MNSDQKLVLKIMILTKNSIFRQTYDFQTYEISIVTKS